MLSALPSSINGVVGMVMDVDESRRDGEPAGVNCARRGPAGEVSDSGDPARANSQVRLIRRIARTVNDAAVDNEDIEILG